MQATPERDRLAYKLARDYMLSLPLVTQDLLNYYLDRAQTREKPREISEVFRRLIGSAQNRGMMDKVVGASIGGVGSLHPVLFGFSPEQTAQAYSSPEELLRHIKKELRPTGQMRQTGRSLWPLFARSVISGARFLSQFSSLRDFQQFVELFDSDDRLRPALPMLLSQEIDGFGFALACDFLKELGFVNFAKPDVHVKAIVRGLALSEPSANDYAVYKAVVRIASNCGKTPYNVDKLFWLVGSGRFYDHPALGKKGRIPTNRDRFIEYAKRSMALTA